MIRKISSDEDATGKPIITLESTLDQRLTLNITEFHNLIKFYTVDVDPKTMSWIEREAIVSVCQDLIKHLRTK
jgi:hypothetical protein